MSSKFARSLKVGAAGIFLFATLSNWNVLIAQAGNSNDARLAKAIKEYPQLLQSAPIELDRLLGKPHVLQVKLSPDGKHVAYAKIEKSGYSVGVLHTETLVQRMLFQSRIIRSIEWSQNGKTLILPTASGVAFADVATAKRGLFVRFKKELDDEFLAVDHSSDCQILILRTTKERDRNAVHQLLRVGLHGHEEVVFEDESKSYDNCLE